MIQDPASCNISNADSPMPISNAAEYKEELLKQFPGTPCFEDHVEVLEHDQALVILRHRSRSLTFL